MALHRFWAGLALSLCAFGAAMAESPSGGSGSMTGLSTVSVSTDGARVAPTPTPVPSGFSAFPTPSALFDTGGLGGPKTGSKGSTAQ
jgi:hypothetical protein